MVLQMQRFQTKVGAVAGAQSIPEMTKIFFKDQLKSLLHSIILPN